MRLRALEEKALANTAEAALARQQAMKTSFHEAGSEIETLVQSTSWRMLPKTMWQLARIVVSFTNTFGSVEGLEKIFPGSINAF